MRRIIGLSGRKRCGKSEIAKLLVEEYGAQRLSIAYYIKEMCYDLLGYTFEDGETKKDDGTTFNITYTPRWIKILNQRTNIPYDVLVNELENITFTDVRQVLQVIGTNIIRKYYPDWHIHKVYNDGILNASDEQLIVIDDVRFPNEYELLSNAGAELFFIVRPDCLNVSQHASETSLKFTDFKTSHVIINDSTLDKLKTSFKYKFANGFDVKLPDSSFLSDNMDYWYEYLSWKDEIKDINNPLVKEQLKLFL